MVSTKKIFRIFIPRDVRNWLRSPTKSAAWTWDEIKFRMGSHQVIQMRPDWSLACHPAAFDFAYHLQHSDPDQVAEFDGFIKHIQPEMVLFDVGAHFGLFSLAALHYGGVSASAVAVDPSPIATRIIRIQARLNNVSERLHVVEASVGDHTGWQSMVAVGVMAGGYFVSPGQDHSSNELTRTRAVTIDELVSDFNTRPTHIKIDVEGDEAAVLQGGRQILSHVNAPLLFVELHNQIVREKGDDPHQALALLRGYGYEIFTVDGLPIDEETILQSDIIRVFAYKSSALAR